MASDVSDFDPQATQARAKRIHDLLADKGTVLGTGKVVVQGSRGGPEPEAAGDSLVFVTHHVSSVTYIDGSGHVHAVLLDDVFTVVAGGGGDTHVLEILSDVVVS